MFGASTLRKRAEGHMTKDHAPPFPPECQTEAEKKAFAFGWFKAMEAQRLAQPEQKHRRLPSWFYIPIGAYLFGLFMGWLIWGNK